MKKKVLLINPSYSYEESPTPPVGLISLAAFIREKGHEVIIEDYVVNNYSRERINSVLDNYKPDYIGATAVTMNVNTALSILKDCHDLCPNAPLMLGGPHATFDAHNLLAGNPWLDVIIRREGELTLDEFLCSERKEYHSIKGLSYRDQNGIAHNVDREFIQDINTLPFPAWDLVELSKYKALGTSINMITSRGCPFSCIFCVGSRMVGNRVRYKDVTRVVDEFEQLRSYGFRQINIADDLFTSHKKRCMEICEEIMRRNIVYPWSAFARVDTVSPELLANMKKAGCTTICFGIESGNQEILDLVKKKINLEKCREAVAMCRESGIIPMASFILGLPGESRATIKQTLEFSKNLCSFYGFHILAPFPGTEVREQAAAYGLSVLSDNWDHYDANRSIAEPAGLTLAEIDAVYADFYGPIQSYARATMENYDRGGTLSEPELEMVTNIKSVVFAQELVHNGVLEEYAGIESSESARVKQDFKDYLENCTGFLADVPNRETYIESEMNKLYERGCLAIKKKNNRSIIAWQ